MGISKASTGAHLKVYINNSIFGAVTGFEITTTPNRKSIYGLDSIFPAELAPTFYTVKGQINCLKLSGDGGLEGRGYSAPANDLLFEKYISITIVDRKTDQVIFQCDQAAITGQTWSAKSKRIIEGNFTFEGITWTSNV